MQVHGTDCSQASTTFYLYNHLYSEARGLQLESNAHIPHKIHKAHTWVAAVNQSPMPVPACQPLDCMLSNCEKKQTKPERAMTVVYFDSLLYHNAMAVLIASRKPASSQPNRVSTSAPFLKTLKVGIWSTLQSIATLEAVSMLHFRNTTPFFFHFGSLATWLKKGAACLQGAHLCKSIGG